MRMLPKKQAPPTPQPAIPDKTLLVPWYQNEEARLNAYAAYRGTLRLEQRLDELLWSFPFTEGSLGSSPEDLKKGPVLEKLHGDGRWDERRELQASALVFYDAQTANTRSAMLRRICKIGEAARDARRRAEVVDALRQQAMKWMDGTAVLREFAALERKMANLGQERTQGLVDESANRLRTVIQEMRALADAGDLMLPPANDRRAKAGSAKKPWVNATIRQLMKLEVRPSDRERQFCDFCNDLLMAWCLRPYKAS
jgi:hypothetical protein